MPWVELDLSTATFALISGQPSGQYVSGKVVHANDRWPDFWISGFTLEPEQVYAFEFEYEYEVPTTGGTSNWAGIYGMSSHSQAAYDASPWWEFNSGRGQRLVTVQVGPGISDYQKAFDAGTMTPFFEVQKDNPLLGLRVYISDWSHGPWHPLDPTPKIGDEPWNENYYATGCRVSDDVVLAAWSHGGYQAAHHFEARAIRWTETGGVVGPHFGGPEPGLDQWGTRYDGELGWVAALGSNVAVVIPNQVYEPDRDVLGWRVHVDPDTLAITYLGQDEWLDGYSARGYSCIIPDPEHVGVLMSLSSGTGWAVFSRATQELADVRVYQDEFMTEVNAAVRLLDGRFLLAAKLLNSDFVPDRGTSGQRGFQPGYTKQSFWVCEANADHTPDIASRQRVITFDDVVDFDGVYMTVLPNGKVHALLDMWSRYLYVGDPQTDRSLLWEIDPTTWTYREAPALPYIYNANSGHLQDYASIQPYEAIGPDVSLWSMIAYDGPGLVVGSFDGTTHVEHLIEPWSSGTSQLWRYSSETYPAGGGFVTLFNGDIFGRPGIPDGSGQVWAICGQGGSSEQLVADFTFEVQGNGYGVDFDASSSSGAIAIYQWQFGDPLFQTSVQVSEPTTSYLYSVVPHTYAVTLTVIGIGGQSASVTKEVALTGGIIASEYLGSDRNFVGRPR